MIAEGFVKRLFRRFREEFGLHFRGLLAFNLLQDVADTLIGSRQAFGFRERRKALHGRKTRLDVRELHAALHENGFHLLSGIPRLTHHHAQTIKEEVQKFSGRVLHAGHRLFHFETGGDERIQRHRQFLFNQHTQHAQSVAAQSERILFAGRQLSDAEHPDERFDLVGQSYGHRFGAGRQGIARKARLIVFTDRNGHFRRFPVIAGIVFTHDALKFGEFTDHQRTEIGLGEHRRTFGLFNGSTDRGGNATGNRLHAEHAFGLRTEFVVVHDMLQAGHAALERFLAVLFVEEFRIRQTGAHHAGVAGHDGVAAVLCLNMRDEGELIHELAVGGAHREILLIRLHGENQAFFRHRKELLFEFRHINHRPFGERRRFIDQVFGRNERTVVGLCSLFEFRDENRTAFGVIGDHLRRLHFGFVSIRRRNFNGSMRMEAVSHRRTAGFKPEHRHGHHVRTVKRGEVLHRTHELHRRHTVGQLIIHHLRNGQRLHGSFKRLLKTRGEFNPRAHAFVVKLFVLTVVFALQSLYRTFNAERRHLPHERRRRLTVRTDTHLHRHQLLAEGFVRGLREHVRNENGHTAGGSKRLHGAFVRHEVGRLQVRGDAVGKSGGQFFQCLRRQFFGLKFN